MLLTLHSKLAVLLLLLLLACFNCCCCGQQVLSYYINTNEYSIYLLNSVVFYVFGDAAEDQARINVEPETESCCAVCEFLFFVLACVISFSCFVCCACAFVDGHPCSGSSADNASAVTCVCAFVLGYLGYLGHLGHEQGLPTLALLVVGLLLRCP